MCDHRNRQNRNFSFSQSFHGDGQQNAKNINWTLNIRIFGPGICESDSSIRIQVDWIKANHLIGPGILRETETN